MQTCKICGCIRETWIALKVLSQNLQANAELFNRSPTAQRCEAVQWADTAARPAMCLAVQRSNNLTTAAVTGHTLTGVPRNMFPCIRGHTQAETFSWTLIKRHDVHPVSYRHGCTTWIFLPTSGSRTRYLVVIGNRPTHLTQHLYNYSLINTFKPVSLEPIYLRTGPYVILLFHLFTVTRILIL